MRALVLSGGGHKGAFQVGAIQHLMGDLQLPYQIFCGVSVGAINAAFLAKYNLDESRQAAKELLTLWEPLVTEQVAKRWFPFGRLHSLWQTGMYNTQPLRDILTKELDRPRIYSTGNKLMVGATSLKTGQYRIFDERYPHLKEAVMASSAFPGVFPAIELENEMWVDGGVRNQTPLKAAIDAGATAIDVIVTEPLDYIANNPKPKNALDVLMTSAGLMAMEVFINDIETAELINQLVRSGHSDKREIPITLIAPENPLPGDLLKFDPVVSKELIARGFAAAKWAVS